MTTKVQMNPLDGVNASANIPFEEFSRWTPHQLTDYLNKLEIPVGEILIKHKISGELVPLLNDRDYEQLGFTTLGDVLKLKRAFAVFQRKARSAQRSIALWEGDEYAVPSCFDQMCFCCKGCYSLDFYKITSTNLSLKQKSPVYCCGCFGPVKGPMANIVRFCQGSEFSVDNVDLHLVTDVDIAGKSANCCQRCCGIAGQDIVVVSSKIGNEEVEKHQLYVKNGEGQRVVTVLRDAVEECRMVR